MWLIRHYSGKAGHKSWQTYLMNIAILAFDDCLSSAVLGLADLLWMASTSNQRHSMRNNKPAVSTLKSAVSQIRPSHPKLIHAPLINTFVVSADGKPLRDGRGRSLPVDAGLHDLPVLDAILLPGLVPDANGLPPQSRAISEAGPWLRKQHAHGALLGASCAGVFVLGEAGLLNARRCTTTWWMHEELVRRFPKARAVWASGLVDDNRVVSVGGPMSWVDLALYTIGQLLGPAVALETANFAVVDNTPLTQAAFAPKRFIEQATPFLLNAEQAVRAAGVGFTAIKLAKFMAISERTLHRRLEASAGESPKAFITRIRLESAKTLLASPASSIKRVALQCGYEDEGSFRRAFNRFSGMTPAAYRSWARQRSGAEILAASSTGIAGSAKCVVS